MDLQKRKKNYGAGHWNGQKKRKQFVLEPGMMGFLCTCNFREKDCVRDAYRILNEFCEDETDKVHVPNNTENNDIKDEQDSDENDISVALNKEISELKAESHTPIPLRRFQVVETGVKNLVFISSSLANPVELVTKIVKELEETKRQRTRFLLRLIPVEVVCKAYMNDIKSKADTLFEKYFSQVPKTFSIVFSRHSNNNIQRSEIIEDLAGIVMRKNPGNKADLKNPELAVIVEVIRGVCLLSVAPDYYKYKKYNLLEICNVKDTVVTQISDIKDEKDLTQISQATRGIDESGVEIDSINSIDEEENGVNSMVPDLKGDNITNINSNLLLSDKNESLSEKIKENDNLITKAEFPSTLLKENE